MTRHEAAQKAHSLFEQGYRVESELIYERSAIRILTLNTGYKWLVEYTRNEKGELTASDVRLFDSRTEALRDNSAAGKLIAYNAFQINAE